MGVCDCLNCDPEWYRVDLDPALNVAIRVGTLESVCAGLESYGLEAYWSPMMIDIAPWIDGDGRIYPGRLVSSGEWVVMDSVSRKNCGTLQVLEKKYIQYRKASD